MRYSPVAAAALTSFWLAIIQVECLHFNFPSFNSESRNKIRLNDDSNIAFDALQVTSEARGASIENMSGRALYIEKFKLWSSKDKKKARFNTTFVLNILNQTNPGGEGIAFILTADAEIPQNSYGQWLGITNEKRSKHWERIADEPFNCAGPNTKIVAVEFDTRKSYENDTDDNHVGLDINSIYSVHQSSLTSYGVHLSSGEDVKVNIQYDTENFSVFVGDDMKNLVLRQRLDLSFYLPEEVFIGFSASTSNFTELNAVRSWEFNDFDNRGEPNLLWVWVTAPILGPLLFLLIGTVLFLYRKMKSQSKELQEAYERMEEMIQGTSTAPRKFRFKELRKATGEFDARNKLGRGGFGTVYWGIIPGNMEVAVKRISKNSSHGKQDFIAEVTAISSLRHRNLVKLIGWCYEIESHEFLLVYEYMPNGSLDKFIFSCNNSNNNNNNSNTGRQELELSWGTRLGIIAGVAHALDYLHFGSERTVLHRDIKTSNIMLDSEFNAKLGDFGLARIIKTTQQTHYSTKEVAGTPGYMAPEIFLTGKATVETDVYAFGVLLLEVACGRETSTSIDLRWCESYAVNKVWELYSRGKILDGVDPRLKGKYKREEMECVLVLGLACCHPDPNERPSMKTVVQVLSGEMPPPLVPIERPIFMWPPKHLGLPSSDYSPMLGSQINSFSELTGR